jgi:hypothetical protein
VFHNAKHTEQNHMLYLLRDVLVFALCILLQIALAFLVSDYFLTHTQYVVLYVQEHTLVSTKIGIVCIDV